MVPRGGIEPSPIQLKFHHFLSGDFPVYLPVDPALSSRPGGCDSVPPYPSRVRVTRYTQDIISAVCCALIQIGLVIQSPPKVEVTRSNRVGRASICWLFRCVPGSLRRPSHQVATAGAKTATSDFFVQHAPGVASAFAYRIFKRRFATCLASPGGLVVMRRARSSAGEHYVDIVGVTGSIPVAPHHQTSEN
jgi:hypothetical protein